MSGRLIIDGNAVYEIDEECMSHMAEKTKGKAEKNHKIRYQDYQGDMRKGSEEVIKN